MITTFTHVRPSFSVLNFHNQAKINVGFVQFRLVLKVILEIYYWNTAVPGILLCIIGSINSQNLEIKIKFKNEIKDLN